MEERFLAWYIIFVPVSGLWSR